MSCLGDGEEQKDTRSEYKIGNEEICKANDERNFAITVHENSSPEMYVIIITGEHKEIADTHEYGWRNVEEIYPAYDKMKVWIRSCDHVTLQ